MTSDSDSDRKPAPTAGPVAGMGPGSAAGSAAGTGTAHAPGDAARPGAAAASSRLGVLAGPASPPAGTGRAGTASASVRGARATRAARRRWLWISLGPVALVFVLLAVFPVANLLGLSLYRVEWQGGDASFHFLGLENYRRLFTEERVFWAGVRNTLVFAVVSVGLQTALGLGMALAVRGAGAVGRPVLTGIFLLPIVIPPVVIGTMWRLVLGREFGLANAILAGLGLPGIDWLGDPATALAAVIFVDVWHWTPFVFLLMLAGLEALDHEVIEAARLDVGRAGRRLRHVILPMMLPTITVTVLLRLILSFKVFDEIYLLTSGGPGTATEVVGFSIYRTFFRQDQTGYGAAMSVVTMMAVGLTIIAARALLARRAAAEDRT